MAAQSSDKLYGHFAPKERLVLVIEAMARNDDEEAVRLRSSCPRKTYIGPDAAFDDRFSLWFDCVAVVCGDLRALTAQLRLLHWTMDDMKHFTGLHHINSDMAFVEGMRCAQGLSQSPFFQRMLVADGEDRAATEERQSDSDDAAGAIEDEPVEDEADLANVHDDMGQRMAAVEDKSHRATELILRVMGRTGNDLAVELLNVWDALGHFCRTRIGLSPERALEACHFPALGELMEMLKFYEHVKPDPEDVAKYREALCGVWDRRFGEREE